MANSGTLGGGLSDSDIARFAEGNVLTGPEGEFLKTSPTAPLDTDAAPNGAIVVRQNDFAVSTVYVKNDGTYGVTQVSANSLITLLGGYYWRANVTNFSDAGATTPSVADDVVALVQSSAMSADLSQTTGANQPLLKLVGDKYHWLFDGTNDNFASQLNSVSEGFVSAIVEFDETGGGFPPVFGSGNGSTTAGNSLYVTKSTKKAGMSLCDGSAAAVIDGHDDCFALPAAFTSAWKNGEQELRVVAAAREFIERGTIAKSVASTNKYFFGKLGSGAFYLKGKIWSIAFVPSWVSEIDRERIIRAQMGDAGITKNLSLIVSGDSTISAYDVYSTVASFLEQSTGAALTNVLDISTAGNTIAQQQAKFITDANDAGYCVVQIGLNDLDPTETAAVALARYQEYITLMNSTGVKVITSQMVPCKARLITLYGATDGLIAYQKWLDMNEAIIGNGPIPITGQIASISAHVALLNDGSGNLLAAYDHGDGIHTNNPGRKINAAAWSVELSKLGIM